MTNRELDLLPIEKSIGESDPIDMDLWKEALEIVGIDALFGIVSRPRDVYEDLVILTAGSA